MRVVSVLLGPVAVAGVGSKPTFAKLVHLYFSNIYIYIYIYIYSMHVISNAKKKEKKNIYIYIFWMSFSHKKARVVYFKETGKRIRCVCLSDFV